MLCRAAGNGSDGIGDLVFSRIATLFKLAACAATAAMAMACSTAIDTPGATGSIKPGTEAADGGAIAKPAAATAERRNERVAKVALLLPMSGIGETAAIAKSMKQAAEMALFDAGSATVQLLVKDDRGTPEGAVTAADEAIKDGAELIVGPLFSANVKAIAPVAQRAGVPVLAFSNDPQAAGHGVYLLSFMVKQDIDRIVGYAAAHGRKRYAALLPDDAYGHLMAQAFRQAVAANGGVVKALETYPPQANAMLDPARRMIDAIKRADEDGESVDAVFIPGGADTLPSLGPMLSYAGLEAARVKLIGTGAWDFQGIGREALFVGGWYAAPEPRGWQTFSERFGKSFGAAPPRIASLGYDAMSIAIELAGNQPGARFTAGNLTRANGFLGADGPVRLRGDGTPERGLAVLEVQRMGTNVLEPASTAFVPARMSAAPSGPLN